MDVNQIRHVYYDILELKELLLKIQKLHIKQTSNLRNLHIHTHTNTHTAPTFEQIDLFKNDVDCIKFRHAKSSPKSSPRWKNLITFSKDIAVVIHNHPSLPYHMTFIQLT